MSWCYVDPCECQLEVPPKTSSYLPKARGNGKPIYFSYAACGAEDEYTKGNEEACVNQDVESNCTKLPRSTDSPVPGGKALFLPFPNSQISQKEVTFPELGEVFLT